MVIKPSSRFLINGKKVSEEQQVEKTLKSTDVASFFAFLEKAENDASVKGHDSKKRSKDRNNEAKEIEKIVEDLGLSYYFVLMNDNYKAGDFGPGNFKIDQDLSEFFLFDAKDVSKLLARLGYSSRDIARLNDNANNQNRISLKSLLSFIENNLPVADNKEVDARFISQFLQNGNLDNGGDILDIFGGNENSDYSFHDVKLLLKQLNNILKRVSESTSFTEIGSNIVDNSPNISRLGEIEPNIILGMQKDSNLLKTLENEEVPFENNVGLEKLKAGDKTSKAHQTLRNSENFVKVQIGTTLEIDHSKTNLYEIENNESLQSQFLNYDAIVSYRQFDAHKTDGTFLKDKMKGFFIHNGNADETAHITSGEKVTEVVSNFGQNSFDMNQSMQQNMNFQFAQQNPVSSDVIFPQPFSTTAGVISFLSDSWTPHLASYIQQMLHEATNRIVIQLEPRELGKLVIHLQSKANRIMTKILTEHEEAKSLLERNQDILRQYLEEQGLQLDGFKVDVGADNAQHEHKWREEEGIINDAVAMGSRNKQTTRSASSSVVRDSENYLIHLYV